jgi:hypothetical protein
MATSGYHGLDRWPSIPLELADPSIPPTTRFQSVFHYLIQLGAHILKIHDVVNNLLRGKTNNTGTITLNPNVATSTLGDVNIGGNSVILFMPTTANAKAEGSPYVTARIKGTATLNHTNNAQADRSYGYVVIG